MLADGGERVDILKQWNQLADEVLTSAEELVKIPEGEVEFQVSDRCWFAAVVLVLMRLVPITGRQSPSSVTFCTAILDPSLAIHGWHLRLTRARPPQSRWCRRTIIIHFK